MAIIRILKHSSTEYESTCYRLVSIIKDPHVVKIIVDGVASVTMDAWASLVFACTFRHSASAIRRHPVVGQLVSWALASVGTILAPIDLTT